MGNANGKVVQEGAGRSQPETHLSIARPSGVGVPIQDVGGRGQGERGRLSPAVSCESMGHTPPESPGSSRSPVMITSQIDWRNSAACELKHVATLCQIWCQVPTTPILKPHESASGPSQSWTYSSSGCEELFYERGIPTMIIWSYGGNDVAVEGSWDNWTTRKHLQRSGKDFAIMMVLPSGVFQYKFIVDGEWKYAPELPWMSDEMGSINNILDVQDYVPENLESVAEFEPPESPDSGYSGPFPAPEDFAKEPPAVPPHLHLTLLNVSSAVEVPGVVPRPQHVILNHLYVEKGKSSQSVLALGSTHRFRTKYVTVVLYKPLKVKV